MQNIGLFILSSLLSLELLSFVATKAELLLSNNTPEIYREQNLGPGWRTQKEPWGAWHKPNVTET